MSLHIKQMKIDRIAMLVMAGASIAFMIGFAIALST
jgi:hypothetical protein